MIVGDFLLYHCVAATVEGFATNPIYLPGLPHGLAEQVTVTMGDSPGVKPGLRKTLPTEHEP